MRRALALAAVFVAGVGVAACSDRENESKGNKGDLEGTTGLTANPSKLQSTAPPETASTQTGSGTVGTTP